MRVLLESDPYLKKRGKKLLMNACNIISAVDHTSKDGAQCPKKKVIIDF